MSGQHLKGTERSGSEQPAHVMDLLEGRLVVPNEAGQRHEALLSDEAVAVGQQTQQRRHHALLKQPL